MQHWDDAELATAAPKADDEYLGWLRQEVQACAAYDAHADLLDECCAVVGRWFARFGERKALWARIRRGRRLASQLAEFAPVLAHARATVAALTLPASGERAAAWSKVHAHSRALAHAIAHWSRYSRACSGLPSAPERRALAAWMPKAGALRYPAPKGRSHDLTISDHPCDHPEAVILDLGSDFGYLSMLLSELLPPDKVQKIVLVDVQWAPHTVTPGPQNLNPEHLHADGWPIRLVSSRCDLKTASDRRNLCRAFLSHGAPVLLVGLHLCGTLALRAVQLFNECARPPHT